MNPVLKVSKFASRTWTRSVCSRRMWSARTSSEPRWQESKEERYYVGDYTPGLRVPPLDASRRGRRRGVSE
ncbi:hypothetical protein SBA2_310008 [Acidobacteriia bacterium SbA2]|nr:hypothetical protein SBA2_310008 [Acidobacteriia bacterium SbA2]